MSVQDGYRRLRRDVLAVDPREIAEERRLVRELREEEERMVREDRDGPDVEVER